MQFSKEQEPVNAVRKYDAESLWIREQAFSGSIAIMPTAIDEDFDCRQINDLNETHLAPFVAAKPEVIIIACGQTVTFPEASVMRAVQRAGIGIEVMNDGAAMRTYNVLLSEERDVVLLVVR
ncbi:MAG: Mth938-like domain-containing protein [Woeseiaceae bacterium]